MERQSDQYIKEYTEKNLKIEFPLLEDHYREFITEKASQAKILACKDCIEKHLLKILGYVNEALKYLPENRDNWNIITVWTNKRLEELPSLMCETDAEEKHIYSIMEELKEMRLKASTKVCHSCLLRDKIDKG
ncbi:MAG: hypothetical protein QME49_01700 [bacterium]|nr:hypothetical protein [bacterium]